MLLLEMIGPFVPCGKHCFRWLGVEGVFDRRGCCYFLRNCLVTFAACYPDFTTRFPPDHPDHCCCPVPSTSPARTTHQLPQPTWLSSVARRAGPSAGQYPLPPEALT